MPIRKKRLNKIEMAFYLRSSNELSEQGFEFGDQVDTPAAQRYLRCPVVLSDGDSKGWVKAFGENTVYGIWLRIAPFGAVVLESVQIRSSFDSFSISLPPLPAHNKKFYFAGTYYGREELLNKCFDRPYPISPGRMVEGLLLAYGVVSIPEELKGKLSQVSVTLVDVCGRRTEEEIAVEVLRYAAPMPLPVADPTAGPGLGRNREPKLEAKNDFGPHSETPQPSGNESQPTCGTKESRQEAELPVTK